MAGRETSQKMKKLTQSAVVVPASSGNVFGMVFRSFGTLSAPQPTYVDMNAGRDLPSSSRLPESSGKHTSLQCKTERRTRYTPSQPC